MDILGLGFQVDGINDRVVGGDVEGLSEGSWQGEILAHVHIYCR